MFSTIKGLFAAAGIFTYFVLIFGLLIGYIMNIYTVVIGFLNSVPFDTMFIGRIIGLFFYPLGGVLGWF